jgi:lysophospholipase L1-like esterase
MFRPDPDAGYRLQSDYRNYVRVPEYRVDIRTDSEGYRVPVESSPEDPSASRILVVGDSFTFGVGVDAEDTFPQVLETRLAGVAPGGWEVRNGGVGGYGPLRTERLLRARQAAWDPDVLVHALYVGNDLLDVRPSSFLEEPRIEKGRMVAGGEARHVRARLYLRTHSHLYAFLRERLYGLYRRTPLAERSQPLDPMGLAEWVGPIREVTWPAAARSIEEIATWARLRGTRYAVMVIPARYQVDDESWARYRKGWGLADDAFDRDHAQREVVELLQRLDVPYLDLLEPMRQATSEGSRLYYEADRHWNAAGHALTARLLHEELDRLGWLRAPDHRSLARR